MQITILGSGTSIPHPQRASPGLVIQMDETTVLVDPSSGSLHRAERYGTATSNIDYVFLSHFHPDHTGDIAPLLFALKNSEYFEARTLTLVGPSGIKSSIADYLIFMAVGSDLSPAAWKFRRLEMSNYVSRSGQ
jgi:ribonuclease BN (tRNA processing enzyme)